MCMMQDPVQNSICYNSIIKYGIPITEIYIGCKNGTFLFISHINQLKKQVGIFLVNWKIAKFILWEVLCYEKLIDLYSLFCGVLTILLPITPILKYDLSINLFKEESL